MGSWAAIALAGFALSSPAIPNTGTIPARFTCDGQGVSPPIRWSKPPPGTHSLTLVVADPDVPTGLFVQWTATGMAPRAASVGQGHPLPHEGLNGSGKRGWAAPCPPRGPSHRYLFILTAMNANGKPIAEVDMITHYKRR